MAKRKEKPPEEGSPAWMATFSDLMNLLLCFFVLLFASSTMDAGKLQKIAASFENMSFSVLPQGAISLIKGMEVTGGVTQLPDVMSVLSQIGYANKETGNNIDENAVGEGKEDSKSQVDDNGNNGAEGMSNKELAEKMEEQGLIQSEEMYEEIQNMLESYAIEDRQKVDYNSQYVELDLNGAILFESGEAGVSRESEIYLQKIASILTKYRDCVIEFEGHTDNVPMSNGKYENNRYLSYARATKVYEYIAGQEKFNPANIKIAGYGEERPLVSNDTPEGRARNRRVVVKIYNQLNSSLEQGDSLQ
ncbi:MAG: flagellar motor protein MotB [Lachnospiraceae bacterium]|nr:flagellar motor protein MotB [Lachnospiraceae bacterium]